MNTQNSTDLQDYYLNELFRIISEIFAISADGDYIYRGEPRCHPEISSTLYRDFRTSISLGGHTIKEFQDFETQSARNYIRDEEKQDFEIASELQHYGGRSNLIDFTRDYHIALYFACAKLGKDGHDKDGRIVLLQRNQETIAKYKIRPAQYPPNRAQAQKSVFVQPPDGFILPNDKDVKTVCIPKELKQWILIHFHRFEDISYQTLFNDIYGFIKQSDLITYRLVEDLAKLVENLTDGERQTLHERTVKAYITRIEYSPYNATLYEELARHYCFEMTKYDCAIETYSKAILLNPDFTNAYIDRGITYSLNGDLDRAIEDLVKATELEPLNSGFYIMLGEAYDRRGDRPLAIENYRKALQQDPSNSRAVENLSRPQRSDISRPRLSEDANYLLNQAAADSERKVEHFNLQQGIIIFTNGKDIIQEDSDRRNIPQDRRETVEAEWESALRKLQDAGYLERIDGHQSLTLFRVTEAGYQHVSQSDSP